tara:strand:- start:2043 stop:2807 length:765 start_codon:yes stop_codon:yes gene_type:complete
MSEEQLEQTEDTIVDTTQETPNTDTSSIEIPEYIPTKFWDVDRNEVKVEELGASYKALESKLGMRTEELSKQIREDLEGERKSSVPESYEIRLPEGLPEDIQIDVDPEQPLIQEWQQICKDNGLSQDIFDKGVSAFVNNEINGLPNIQEEMQELGDNAKSRVEAADLWSRKYLSNDAYTTIANLASTAEGVKAIEELMSLNKSSPLPNANTVIDVELDDNDLKSMMADPRYWDPSRRDPAFVARVTGLFQKKHG